MSSPPSKSAQDPPPSSAEAVAAIQAAFPKQGLFAGKEWRLSPEGFPLSPKTFRQLESLGGLLHRFQRASDTLYRRSRNGSLPPWLHQYLDRGKPPQLIEHGFDPRIQAQLPRVIRPDLILTDDGFAMAELDSVPGGIGLTAWLNQTYSQTLGDPTIIGGADGMIAGFASTFPHGADLVISAEASDYRPESEWLVEQLNTSASQTGKLWQLHPAESYQSEVGRAVYRFFELFDLPNLPGIEKLASQAADGGIDLSPPFKAFLEEKMWLALFWSHPLREIWQRELRASNWQRLQQIIPRSWIVDPTPLPHHGVIPKLEINHFQELKDFSQRERAFVLKISGFSEMGWGSRSVSIGHDLSQEEWGKALEDALASFDRHPYVLQEFHSGRLVHHPYLDPGSGKIVDMEGRVRLCPYYFTPPPATGGGIPPVILGGVLATICPADKKILHGMSEAIMVPCRIHQNGY